MVSMAADVAWGLISPDGEPRRLVDLVSAWQEQTKLLLVFGR